MGKVPRHRFVPEGAEREAYADMPLPIGHGQTISQPFIVALMSHLAKAGPESTVLEIGTGSGYQAAVLSPLVKTVCTIEIIPQLGRLPPAVFGISATPTSGQGSAMAILDGRSAALSMGFW